MDLAGAITAVENGVTAYNSAVAQTATDKASATAIQAKLDAANQVIALDVQAGKQAASGLNAALDTLIQVATAAKVATE